MNRNIEDLFMAPGAPFSQDVTSSRFRDDSDNAAKIARRRARCAPPRFKPRKFN